MTRPTLGICRPRSISLLSTLVHLVAWLAGQAAWGQAVEPAAFGHQDPTRELVRLEWPELAQGIHEASGASLVLHVRSLADEPLDLTVRWSADTGDAKRWSGASEVVALRPRASTRFEIDLERAGVELDDMRFSGQVLANVTATRPGSAEPLFHAYSPEAFFHRKGETTLLYGGEVLRERFGAGDIAGRVPTTDAVRVQRVAGGTQEPPTRPGDLASNDRRICVKWQVGVTDGNNWIQNVEGETLREDFWVPTLGPDDIVPPGYDPTQFSVTAHGVRVHLADGDWQQFFDADPATGCFTFSRNVSDEIVMTVLGYSTDAAGNRIKAGWPLPQGLVWPYGWVLVIAPPSPGQALTVPVGNYSAEATLAAISAFSAYRQNFGLAGKEMNLRETGLCTAPGGNSSSAHFDASDLPQGTAHVRIHNGAGSTEGGACSGADMRRWKYLVGHEMGHAWLLLAIGRDAFEPGTSTKLCDFSESVCGTGPGYSIGSLEWSAVAIREGIAHFYAAWVWNRHQSRYGVFNWFGGRHDVEFDDEAEPGGRLYNVCDSTASRCGRGVILDWLRFFWDWHTPASNSKPSMATIRDVYVAWVLADLDGDLEVTKDNAYYRLRQAMLGKVASQTQRDAWDAFAKLNGVATSHSAAECGVDSCPKPEKPTVACQETFPGHFGSEQGHPDGDFGLGYYCSDHDGEAVCLEQGGEGACVKCDEGEFKASGCVCENDQECGPGATCFGTDTGPGHVEGKCYPTDEGPPWWQCELNCDALFGNGYCFNDHPAGYARCVDQLSSPVEAAACFEDQEQPLSVFDGECVSECETENSECQALGYPDHWICNIQLGVVACTPENQLP